MNIEKESLLNKNIKSESQSMDDLKWLTRMLPFITKVILVLTIFFFSATIYQLFDLNRRVDNAPKLSVEQYLLDNVETYDANYKWKTLIALESHALQQRYHQANVLLMARIWVRYLGFITGMMLSIIGAIFVLGKLREPKTEMSVGGSVQAQIATQSPGIILVLLGSVIMLTTILNHNRIAVIDAPIYIPQSFSFASAVVPEKVNAPLQLDENSIPDDGDDIFKYIDDKSKEEGEER